MRERDVARLAGRHGERQADDLRLQRIEARGLGVEADELGRLDARAPARERRLVGDDLVADAFRLAGRVGRRLGDVEAAPAGVLRRAPRNLAGGVGGGRARRCGRLVAQQAPELVALVDRTQRVLAHRVDRQLVEGDGQLAIGLHRQQAPPLRQPVESLAQVLADDTRDLGRVRDDVVERAVLREPFDRGLRPDLVDAGHVVDRIADQRQVVEELVGAHAELGEHTRLVQRLVGHRVDAGDAGHDELRHVLVAGGDQRLDIRALGRVRQRGDDVVRLDAFDHQQRPAMRAHQRVQRLDLAREILGHRRPVRLVLRIPVVAKRLARRVEHHGEVVGRRVVDELLQHRQHAAHRAGGLAARGAQVRQRVKRAVEVRRAVDEDEFGHGLDCAPGGAGTGRDPADAPRRDPPLLHGTRRDLSTRTIGPTAAGARSRNTAGRIPAAAFVKRVAGVRFC